MQTKPKRERRDLILRVRLSESEAKLIADFAAVAGVTVSRYVRDVALNPGRWRAKR